MKRLTYFDNGHWRLKWKGCEYSAEWVDRLAAIEDILGDEYDLERLRELVQAEKDGRLMVLPCKVGDTVYLPNKRGLISTYKVTSIHISACSVLVGWEPTDGIYSNVNGFEASVLGKSVFLIREEAEAALKGGEQ